MQNLNLHTSNQDIISVAYTWCLSYLNLFFLFFLRIIQFISMSQIICHKPYKLIIKKKKKVIVVLAMLPLPGFFL